jgi:hypothetical protein
MKTKKALFVLLTVLILVTGCSKASKISLMHIHGLGLSNDGKQLIIPAHDGLLVYSDGKWSAMEGKKHDYMGFNIVDNGFYSSGHPATDSGLKNPLGIVKSIDNGKTLQRLDLYGIEDFHTMAVGFKSHTIYVYNPKPNAKMDSSGLYYSTDDTKTWNKSEMNGLSGEPFTIAVHPSESATVAIGTKERLFISKDFGNHFEALARTSLTTALTYGKQGTLLIGGMNSIVEQNGNDSISIKIPALDQDDAVAYITQNPVNENEIVFATFKKSVYRSSDKGATWNEMIHFGDVN